MQNPGSKVYGVPLASLVSDERKIPVIVERLIVAIETHGMYTIGVYRKSGANAKVKQLKQNIDSGKEGETHNCANSICQFWIATDRHAHCNYSRGITQNSELNQAI